MVAREPDAASAPTRRLTLELRRWPLRVAFGVRPTVVVDGRTEPAQWGVGTWLIAADRPVDISVFLFVAGARLARGVITVHPADERVTYRAPWLPFLPARMSSSA